MEKCSLCNQEFDLIKYDSYENRIKSIEKDIIGEDDNPDENFLEAMKIAKNDGILDEKSIENSIYGECHIGCLVKRIKEEVQYKKQIGQKMPKEN